MTGQRCFNTGRVLIGSMYQRPMPGMCRDAERLQSALLEPKTAIPATMLHRLVGAIVRWL